MTEHVLSGLTKRRAELAGEAEALRTRLAQIGNATFRDALMATEIRPRPQARRFRNLKFW